MTVSTKSRPHDSGRRCGRMQVWLGKRKPSGLAISDWVITEFPAALSMKLWNGQIEAIYRCPRPASDVLGAAETLAVSSTTRTAYPCASSSFATLLPPKTGALLRNSIQKFPVKSMIAVSSIRVRSAHGNSFAHTNETNIGLWPVLRVQSD